MCYIHKLYIVTHTTASIFHVVFSEANDNLKPHVPRNSVYQHKTNINNSIGKRWVNI